MLYPDHNLTGAEWTAPEFLTDSTIKHFWAGWTWRVLGQSRTSDEQDMWRFCRIPPGRKALAEEIEHGIDLRVWMRLPHPAYNPDHLKRLVIDRYIQSHAGSWDFAKHIYESSGGDYDAAIRELRRWYVQGCSGHTSTAMSYSTRKGKLIVTRPQHMTIDLFEVCRRAFPHPKADGKKVVQLALF